jgi:hypothetical protein
MLRKASLLFLFSLHAFMCTLIKLALEALSLFFVAAGIESSAIGLDSACLDSRLREYWKLALQRLVRDGSTHHICS